jgi:hypothetical protein
MRRNYYDCTAVLKSGTVTVRSVTEVVGYLNIGFSSERFYGERVRIYYNIVKIELTTLRPVLLIS